MANEKKLIQVCEVGKKLISDYLKITEASLGEVPLYLFKAWLDQNIDDLKREIG